MIKKIYLAACYNSINSTNTLPLKINIMGKKINHRLKVLLEQTQHKYKQFPEFRWLICWENPFAFMINIKKLNQTWFLVHEKQYKEEHNTNLKHYLIVQGKILNMSYRRFKTNEYGYCITYLTDHKTLTVRIWQISLAVT